MTRTSSLDAIGSSSPTDHACIWCAQAGEDLEPLDVPWFDSVPWRTTDLRVHVHPEHREQAFAYFGRSEFAFWPGLLFVLGVVASVVFVAASAESGRIDERWTELAVYVGLMLVAASVAIHLYPPLSVVRRYGAERTQRRVGSLAAMVVVGVQLYFALR